MKQVCRHSEYATPNAPQGKKAILVLARGGVYSEGLMKQLDFQESYLRSILGFIGITDVRVVRVEGVDMGENARINAMVSAKTQSEALVREFARSNVEKEFGGDQLVAAVS